MATPKLSEILAGLRAKAAAIVPRRTRIMVLLAVLALAVVLFAWKLFAPGLVSKPTPAPMQIAPPATALAGLEKQPLPQPVVVRAYPKAQAVKRLHLPPEVGNDPNQQVISSAELKPSRGGYVTATVLDTATGEAVTRVTEKPRPLFELGGQTEVGLRYGITTRGGQQGTLYARQDLVRVGLVSVSGYVEAAAGPAASPAATAQIDARISW